MFLGPRFPRQFHGEIDRGDHALRARDIFSSDFEGGAVVGTSARKGKTERDIHPFVKRMQLQRDKPLVVIHAEDAVPVAIRRVTENRVGRKRAGQIRCESG